MQSPSRRDPEEDSLAKQMGAKFWQLRFQHELHMKMQEQLHGQQQKQQQAALQRWNCSLKGGLHPIPQLRLAPVLDWPHTSGYPTMAPLAAEFGTSADQNVMNAIHAAMLPEDVVHAAAPIETKKAGVETDNDEVLGTSLDEEVMKVVYAAMLPEDLARDMAAPSQDPVETCRPEPAAPSLRPPGLFPRTSVQAGQAPPGTFGREGIYASAPSRCLVGVTEPNLVQASSPKKVFPTAPPGIFAPVQAPVGQDFAGPGKQCVRPGEARMTNGPTQNAGATVDSTSSMDVKIESDDESWPEEEGDSSDEALLRRMRTDVMRFLEPCTAEQSFREEAVM